MLGGPRSTTSAAMAQPRKIKTTVCHAAFIILLMYASSAVGTDVPAQLRNETEMDEFEEHETCEPCPDDIVPELPDCECLVQVLEGHQNRTNSSGTSAGMQTGMQPNEIGSLPITSIKASESPKNFTVFASSLNNLFVPVPVISETESSSIKGNATGHDKNVTLPPEPPATQTKDITVDNEIQDTSTEESSIPKMASDTVLPETPLNTSLSNSNLGDENLPVPGLQLHTAPADVTDEPDENTDPGLDAGFENGTISIPETESTGITSLPETEPSSVSNITNDMSPVVEESYNTTVPETALVADEVSEGPLGADDRVAVASIKFLLEGISISRFNSGMKQELRQDFSEASGQPLDNVRVISASSTWSGDVMVVLYVMYRAHEKHLAESFRERLFMSPSKILKDHSDITSPTAVQEGGFQTEAEFDTFTETYAMVLDKIKRTPLVDSDQVLAVQGRIGVMDIGMADFESSGMENRMRLAVAYSLNKELETVFITDVVPGSVIVDLLVVFRDFEGATAEEYMDKLGSSPELLLTSDPVFARGGVEKQLHATLMQITYAEVLDLVDRREKKVRPGSAGQVPPTVEEDPASLSPADDLLARDDGHIKEEPHHDAAEGETVRQEEVVRLEEEDSKGTLQKISGLFANAKDGADGWWRSLPLWQQIIIPVAAGLGLVLIVSAAVAIPCMRKRRRRKAEDNRHTIDFSRYEAEYEADFSVHV